MREIFLEGKDLLKVYGPTTAVNHLDINVYQGEVLALVGGNGAGKSTLARRLATTLRFLYVDTGAIYRINLNKYTPATARSKGIRVVHQGCPYARI